MKSAHKIGLFIGGICFCSLFFSQCQTDRMAGFRYASTPVNGWENTDSISFPIDTITKGGNYLLNIGLRTSAANPYPFKSISLRVDLRLNNRIYADTISCPLTDEQGDVNGHGVSLYQYNFNTDTLHIPPLSSGRITIRHIMRRQLIQGISEVGFYLKRL